MLKDLVIFLTRTIVVICYIIVVALVLLVWDRHFDDWDIPKTYFRGYFGWFYNLLSTQIFIMGLFMFIVPTMLSIYILSNYELDKWGCIDLVGFLLLCYCVAGLLFWSSGYAKDIKGTT